MTIGIIDLGVGNLGSLESAMCKLNKNYKICKSLSDFQNIKKIILPGVGAFKDFMFKMIDREIDKVILQKSDEKIPVLGVCLGFQILFSESTEHGLNKGLNILKGKIDNFKNISANIKVPHVGWNECKYVKNSPLFKNISDKSDFYFTHSFFLNEYSNQDVISETNYNIKFVSAINKGNIYGVQFHPEKSQLNDLKLLKNFSEIC